MQRVLHVLEFEWLMIASIFLTLARPSLRTARTEHEPCQHCPRPGLPPCQAENCAALEDDAGFQQEPALGLGAAAAEAETGRDVAQLHDRTLTAHKEKAVLVGR